MNFKLCFYIANATNVFLSSILDILLERGIPHQISPSTYHPWCYSVVSPVYEVLGVSYNRQIFIWVFLPTLQNLTHANISWPQHHFFSEMIRHHPI